MKYRKGQQEDHKSHNIYLKYLYQPHVTEHETHPYISIYIYIF